MKLSSIAVFLQSDSEIDDELEQSLRRKALESMNSRKRNSSE